MHGYSQEMSLVVALHCINHLEPSGRTQFSLREVETLKTLIDGCPISVEVIKVWFDVMSSSVYNVKKRWLTKLFTLLF